MVIASPALIPTLTPAPTAVAKPKPTAKDAPPVGTANAKAPTANIPDAKSATTSTQVFCPSLYLFKASCASSVEISPRSACFITFSICLEPDFAPNRFLILSQAFPIIPCCFLVSSNSFLKSDLLLDVNSSWAICPGIVAFIF